MARVAIVGSGFIGRAWAISFARAGHDVALWDQDPGAPDRAIDFVASVAPDLAANDLLGGVDPQVLLARLRVEKTLPAALADVDHVQENAPEQLDVKKVALRRSRSPGTGNRRPCEFELRNSAVAFHGAFAASSPLPRYSSDQSSLFDPGRGSGAGALDIA